MTMRPLTILLYLLATAGLSATSVRGADLLFRLESLRTGTTFGPFAFQNGALVRTDTGTFQLQVRQGRTFNLVSTANPAAIFGVYELTLGRMIEVGDGVFTIVGIAETAGGAAATTRAPVPASIPVWKGLFFGADVDLFNRTLYDWEIDGIGSGTEETVDRSALALVFGHRCFGARAGVVTGAEWDHTLAGNEDFADATLGDGRGWFISLATRIPVFEDGAWTAHLTGEVGYRQEDYALDYSAVGISGVTTTFSTNVAEGVTNIQPVSVTTNFQFTTFSRDASLTETSIRVGIDLTYARKDWSVYAGVSVYPFIETDLDAGIRIAGETFDIEFERTHPVVVSGGASVTVLGLKWYLEAGVGSASSLRVGLLKEL